MTNEDFIKYVDSEYHNEEINNHLKTILNLIEKNRQYEQSLDCLQNKIDLLEQRIATYPLIFGGSLDYLKSLYDSQTKITLLVIETLGEFFISKMNLITTFPTTTSSEEEEKVDKIMEEIEKRSYFEKSRFKEKTYT